MKVFPYSRQKIDQNDIKSVTKVLKSNFLTQGSMVPRFEKLVAKKIGSKYSVALNSATSALHVGCMSLNVKKGDIVWTSANSFVASINCAKYLGAKIDLVDIDKDTFNLSTYELKKKLISAKKKRKLPKLIIIVHFAGLSCDLKEIYKLSKRYKFKIIEDASHAIGSKYYKNKIGDCKYSDITVFSFHPVKIITSGEGGMCLTNNKDLMNKMLLFRSHGITKDYKMFKKKENRYPWYYEQQTLGYNYRMSDIHAALGISQLNKLDKFVKERNKIAKNYFKLLKDLPIFLPKYKKGLLSAFHLFIIRIDFKKTKKTYNDLFEYLRKKKLWVNLHYLPIYSHPYYSKDFNKNNFKNMETYYKSSISIPIYPGLTLKNQIYIKETLEKFFDEKKN